MMANKCIEFLEKSKNYQLAVYLLLQLLIMRVKKHKRAKWWYRLALDLNHLNMSVEAFCI